MRYSIGLDVGGTNLSAGVVDETGTVISHAVLPADAGRSIVAITSDMAEVSRMAVRNAGMEISDMSSWGIGMPSCINPATGLLVHANFLQKLMLRQENDMHIRMLYSVCSTRCCSCGQKCRMAICCRKMCFNRLV